MNENNKHASLEQDLFQKYAILTDELLKFVKGEDIDTFLELFEQREQIGKKLLDIKPLHYPSTPSGKSMLKDVYQKEKEILLFGKAYLNRAKTKTETVRTYDILKTDMEAQTIGSRLNQET